MSGLPDDPAVMFLFSEAELIMFHRLATRLTQAHVWDHSIRLNEWEVDGVRRVLEAVGLDQ